MSRDDPRTCPICGTRPPENTTRETPTLGCRCGAVMSAQDMRRHPGTQGRTGRIAPIICRACYSRALREPDSLARRVARDLTTAAGAALTVVALGVFYDIAAVVVR